MPDVWPCFDLNHGGSHSSPGTRPRTPQRQASCRLLLRGVGAPGSKETEQLHLIVKPKAGEGETVTQEQTEAGQTEEEQLLKYRRSFAGGLVGNTFYACFFSSKVLV